jgi:hypothetical protein
MKLWILLAFIFLMCMTIALSMFNSVPLVEVEKISLNAVKELVANSTSV